MRDSLLPLCLSFLLVSQLSVCQPALLPGGRTAGERELAPKAQDLTRQAAELAVTVEVIMDGFDTIPPPPLPDDGVERTFSPAREIARSPVSGGVYLLRNRGGVGTFTRGRVPGSLGFIDADLRMKEKEMPPFLGVVQPAPAVSAVRGLYFFTVNSALLPKPTSAVLRAAEDGQMTEVISFRGPEVVGEGHIPRERSVLSIRDFFEWGDGYGMLCGVSTLRIDDERKRAWVVRFDANFRRTGVFLIRGGGMGAMAVGPTKAIAAITQSKSVVFLSFSGDRHVIPIAEPKPWAEEMFGGARPSLLLWTRPGIVPGSELLAMPYADRGTLPVFDITTTPPKVLHTLDVGGVSLARVVSLVSGRRVYVKRDTSNTITSYDFSGDGVKVLWVRVFPGSDNKGQAYLGYHKGNIIAPGLAKITFIDEDTGLVNYEFLAPDAARQPARPDDGKPQLSRAAPYILSYAILDNYLIGSSRNREKPLYVWKIPEKLIPRKPLAVPAGDGK